jgi:hypothetical protein
MRRPLLALGRNATGKRNKQRKVIPVQALRDLGGLEVILVVGL